MYLRNTCTVEMHNRQIAILHAHTALSTFTAAMNLL